MENKDQKFRQDKKIETISVGVGLITLLALRLNLAAAILATAYGGSRLYERFLQRNRSRS